MSIKVSLPLIRAFMVDMNLMSSSVSGAQNLLECCTTALKWARMDFEPIRFLGRIIDGSISDRKAIDELGNKLLDGLTILDKSCFRGPQ